MTSRPCSEPGCEIPAAPRSPRCGWHRLARLPIADQDEAARARRAASERRQGYEYRARLPKALVPPGARWCAGCQALVPDWYVSKSRCRAHARMQSRASHTSLAYGLTGDQYEELLALQGGRCAICGANPRSKALAVDHDHETGAVRGLLCSRCNHDLLGAAHDSLDILRAAVHYLQTPPASGAWTAPQRSTPAKDYGDPPF